MAPITGALTWCQAILERITEPLDKL